MILTNQHTAYSFITQLQKKNFTEENFLQVS